MPSFDKPVLRMARRVADIKRGEKSIEEKTEAIGRFVITFLLETARRGAGEPRAVLPPVSRIRASLEGPRADEERAPAFDEMPCTEAVSAAPPLRIIHIKPPIMVRQLAAELGLQPHRLIAELMSFNIFANINQTVEPDIASKICQNHGFVLEKEGREKAAA